MKIVAVVNERSRSVPADAIDKLDATIKSNNQTAEIVSMSDLTRKDGTCDFAPVLRRSPDLIVVWGGDGSVSAMLSESGPDGPPVLALPGGTMNLLHKRFHGPEPKWDAVLSAGLTTPDVRSVPAGLAEGRHFYVAMLAGELTGMATAREQVREGALIEAAKTALTSNILDMSAVLTLRTKGRGARKPVDAVAAAVLVGARDAGALEYAAINPESPLDLAALAADALLNGWRESDKVNSGSARKLWIDHSKGSTVPVTLDGEQAEFKSGGIVGFRLRAARAVFTWQA